MVDGGYLTPTGLLRGFLFHGVRAAEVDQSEQVVGQSWARFQVRPCGGSPVPSATRAVASWLARRLHAPHRRDTHGRSFPAVTLARPGRRLAGLSQGSGSSSSVPRRRVLRSARPSMERTPAKLRRSHRPTLPSPPTPATSGPCSRRNAPSVPLIRAPSTGGGIDGTGRDVSCRRPIHGSVPASGCLCRVTAAVKHPDRLATKL
jgi:hypothetical protein